MPGTLLRVLCLLCFVMFAWLLVGKVDIIAEAPGRLIPKTFIQVVQPADAGVVTEVLVAEGDSVKQGQLLVKLDPVVAQADQGSTRSEQQQLDLQVRRIDAELTNSPFLPTATDPPQFAAQSLAQYVARRNAYQQQLRTETAGLDKLKADLLSAAETVKRFQRTQGSYNEIEGAYKSLEAQGLQPHATTLEKTRDRIDHEQELASQSFTAKGLKAAVHQSEQRLLQISADYIKELRLERSDTLLRLEKARNELAKQDHRTNALELKAPMDAVVKDVAAHTAGTVVSPGTVLLTLVPVKVPLRAEVWVKNEDAGFVFPGQAVQLKVATYPFQKYGLLHGKVLVLSPDAADAQQSSSATPGQTQGPAGQQGQQGQPAQSAQFRALVELDQQTLVAQEKVFQLRPGMQVVAEVNQGKRTVMEYLLSPVSKSVREAARER